MIIICVWGGSTSKCMFGMNAKLMAQYIKFVADYLLIKVGQPKFYRTKNSFSWMDENNKFRSRSNKANFFECRVGEYEKSGINITTGNHSFSLDEDFSRATIQKNQQQQNKIANFNLHPKITQYPARVSVRARFLSFTTKRLLRSSHFAFQQQQQQLTSYNLLCVPSHVKAVASSTSNCCSLIPSTWERDAILSRRATKPYTNLGRQRTKLTIMRRRRMMTTTTLCTARSIVFTTNVMKNF